MEISYRKLLSIIVSDTTIHIREEGIEPIKRETKVFPFKGSYWRVSYVRSYGIIVVQKFYECTLVIPMAIETIQFIDPMEE